MCWHQRSINKGNVDSCSNNWVQKELYEISCRGVDKIKIAPLLDAKPVIKAQFFKYWLKVGSSRKWGLMAGLQKKKRRSKRRWKRRRCRLANEPDEMRWEGGREGESVYYIWWARPPYMDFFPIINAGHFAYKILITPLWTAYENLIEPRKRVISQIIIFQISDQKRKLSLHSTPLWI